MDSSSQVRVIVRIRPLLPHEPPQSGTPCVRVTQVEKQPAIILRETQTDSFGKETHGETMLTYDGVYDQSVSQQELFESEVLPHLQTRVFNGCTATLFAYGMTGTGKSHTMNGVATNPGLIPRTMQHLFDSIQDRIACGEQTAESTVVSFSYFELFNEKIYDLLKPAVVGPSKPLDRGAPDSSTPRDPPGDLPVREDASGKVFVANLYEQPLKSFTEFSAAYALGMKNRKIASTKYNTASSRAHTMIQIKVEFRTTGLPSKKVTGRLQLLDLAGNEDNRFSGNTSSKSRMAESSKINNSLFVLGKVINSLNAGDTRIPYRDSKLTRLLQDSLGGGNYSIMICNISPNPSHMSWTQRTLTFAMKSRQVVNNVERNIVDHSVLLAAQQEEEERREALRLRIESRKNSRPTSAAAAAAALQAATPTMGPLTAAARAKRVASTLHANGAPSTANGISASHTTTIIHQPKADPTIMKQLASLTNEMSSMKAALVAQQRQHQQLLRPSAAALAQPSAPAPSVSRSGPVVPLTPVSMADLARNCVEKARVYEKNGHLQQALDEYHEAARFRPNHSRLLLKIQQLEGKIQTITTHTTSNQTNNSALNRPALKHARDNQETNRPNKHRKLDALTKAIPEDTEEEDEEEGEEEEEEADDDEEEQDSDVDYDDETDSDAMSDSDYSADDTTPIRPSHNRAARAASRSSSSPPSTSSSLTSPEPTSALMQRLNRVQMISPNTASIPVTSSANTPTNLNTSGKAKSRTPQQRTPLGTINTQPKANTPTNNKTPTAVTKKTSGKANSKGSPNTNTLGGSSTGKENVPMNVTPLASSKSLTHLVSPASISPVVVRAPITAPTVDLLPPPPTTGLMGDTFSNLVAARTALLEVLNNGTLKELMKLQTIGMKRAELIMAKRQQGRYNTIDDLIHTGLTKKQVEQFSNQNLSRAAEQIMATL